MTGTIDDEVRALGNLVIARTITGARWNGPRFFGLRNAEAPK
jgi:hypothetical protein